MTADNELYRETLYWRELLARVAEELESKAGTESDPTRKRWLSARAMRIRRRLHEGVPDDFEPPMPENNQRVRFLVDEEETALREAIGEEHWPLVAVAIHTGLRQGEQFNLRWENVDFSTGIITIPRSKHGESRRVVMNDTVRETLRSLASRLKSAYVFPKAKGDTPLDAKNFLHRVFLPALKRARVEGLRWHDLRHTFASRLVMAGVDIRTVQELMGTRRSQ